MGEFDPETEIALVKQQAGFLKSMHEAHLARCAERHRLLDIVAVENTKRFTDVGKGFGEVDKKLGVLDERTKGHGRILEGVFLLSVAVLGGVITAAIKLFEVLAVANGGGL